MDNLEQIKQEIRQIKTHLIDIRDYRFDDKTIDYIERHLDKIKETIKEVEREAGNKTLRLLLEIWENTSVYADEGEDSLEEFMYNVKQYLSQQETGGNDE